MRLRLFLEANFKDDDEAWGDMGWSAADKKEYAKLEKAKELQARLQAFQANSRYNDEEEVYVIVSKMFKDDIISVMFGRSIQAIQVKRSELLTKHIPKWKTITKKDLGFYIQMFFLPEVWRNSAYAKKRIKELKKFAKEIEKMGGVFSNGFEK